MLQRRTVVGASDNTGVLKTRIFQLYPGDYKTVGYDHYVRVSVHAIKRLKKTKKMSLRRFRRVVFKKGRRLGIVVRLKRDDLFLDGSVLKFKTSDVILYKKKGMYKGKRFFGVISRSVRYLKLRSLFMMFF